MDEKHICTNCEHCIVETIFSKANAGVEYAKERKYFKCENLILSIDYVTGEITYGDCEIKNASGQCIEYSRLKTSEEKIIEKIKNVFKNN